MKRLACVAILIASSSARADDVDDPRVLFAEGRYAAAAQVFEHRWQAKGDGTDGVNAVVAWRTAGHYARALSLLTRVRSGKKPPEGDALATATELEERLATLTARATIDGPVDDSTVVGIDADPAERIGAELVLDVGEHDIEIEKSGCKRFLQHVTAYPGAQLVVPYQPTCEQSGVLHVYLAAEPGQRFSVDGKAQASAEHEADVKLEPGTHQLHVEARDRPVYDEPVAIQPHETTAVRIRFPWRAQKLGIVLGITTEVRSGQHMTGIGLALTAGIWGSRFHFTFDGGSMISNAAGLVPASPVAPGHPWIADTLVYHLQNGPLWHGKAGPYRLAFDIEPLGARFDEIRQVSYFGIRNRCDNIEPRLRSWSAFPLALSADGPYVHTEITLWPVSRVYLHPGSGDCGVSLPSETGWGAFVTVTGGWRL